MVVNKKDFFFTLDKYSRLKMIPILFMMVMLLEKMKIVFEINFQTF